MSITLYGFGAAFGLPDPSPFVVKVQVLLKMAGLPFHVDVDGFSKAPKGKLPYINDGGKIVADSTFIRAHIETAYGYDFDRGLSTEQKAVAWAFEKMAEEHLYWAVIDARWTPDSQFDKGPRRFFDKVPLPLRPLVVRMVRRQVRRQLHAQGLGRHAPDEIAYLARRSIDAIADYLDRKPFFMGAEPTGVDATVYALASGVLCPHFESPLREAAERHAHLADYAARMTTRYFPEGAGGG